MWQVVKQDLPFGSAFKCSMLPSKPVLIFSGSLEAMLINNSIKGKSELSSNWKEFKMPSVIERVDGMSDKG